MSVFDPAHPPAELFESQEPVVIGVRHHSVACALAMPALLEAAAPEQLFIELASEFQPLLPWVGHPETKGPVALASVRDDEVLSFCPLAEFSPERVAIDWAVARGVPLVAFDSSAGPGEIPPEPLWPNAAKAPLTDGEFSVLWDDTVEARVGGEAEDIRRAALRAGWALRVRTPPGPRDLSRETAMRSALAAAEGKAVAVVGAFHGAALLKNPLLYREAPEAPVAAPSTSLVSYSDALLDSRSGYPAGIEDPAWHAAVFEGMRTGQGIEEVLLAQATRLVRFARRRGHVGGTPAAVEIVRMAKGLARLRGNPGVSRRELLEAARTVLGRGNDTAFDRLAMQAFVGTASGRVAKGAPRTGLRASLEQLLEKLRLPQRGGSGRALSERGVSQRGSSPGGAKELRLDVFRSELDRRRHVCLKQMAIAGIHYGQLRETVAAGGIESLQMAWSCEWTPNTEATIEAAGRFGVTLAQVVRGALNSQARHAEETEELGPERRRRLLESALEAGLGELAGHWLRQWQSLWIDADLPRLVAWVRLLRRWLAGHVVGVAPEEHPKLRDAVSASLLDAASLVDATLEGLAGSQRLEDAQALGEWVRFSDGGDRLRLRLEALAADAVPLMRGAARGAGLLAGYDGVFVMPATGSWLASWVSRATASAGRRDLAAVLHGLFACCGSLLEVAPAVMDALAECIESLSDEGFLSRLPALRSGFGVLSKGDRRRLIAVLAERGKVDVRSLERLPVSPEDLVRYAQLDQAAFAALGAKLGSRLPVSFEDAPSKKSAGTHTDSGPQEPDIEAAHALSTSDRWRLILGQQPQQRSPFAERVGLAIDGHGGGGASDDPSVPALREWLGELEALFGVDVCQEVVAERAENDPRLLTELDPKALRPSVELLTQMLNLAGSLGERDLEKVRPLIARCTEELTRELQNKVTPALHGARSATPTRRQTSRLDLRRTVRRNLHTARRSAAGIYLVPETPIFLSAEKKRLTWEVQILLDVSGSMEPSVVHTALMAGILAGVPWVDLKLYGFSTEVVDLSEHVSDPLSLLLSVRVGGGTDIGGAVAFARSEIKNPARTMLILVSDFEEMGTGARLLAEVEGLRESGVRMLGIAALDASGVARYNTALAQRLQHRGMNVAAVSPSQLARWMKEQVA